MKPASVKSRVLGRLVSVLLVPVIFSSSVTTVYVSADDEVVDVVDDNTVTDAPVDGQIDDNLDTTDSDGNDNSATFDVVVGDDAASDDANPGNANSDDAAEGTADDVTDDPADTDVLEIGADDLDDEALILEQKTPGVLGMSRTFETVNVNVSIELTNPDDKTDWNAFVLKADGRRIWNGNSNISVQYEYATDEAGNTRLAGKFIKFEYELKKYYKITEICWNGEVIAADALSKLAFEEGSENTLSVKFECTDTSAPVIETPAKPDETLLNDEGEYFSSDSSKLAISVEVSDDTEMAEVWIKTDRGTFPMDGNGTYSWTPSDPGDCTIQQIIAKDIFGREKTQDVSPEIKICLDKGPNLENLEVTLSDYGWHSIDNKGALSITASIYSYRKVECIVIDGEEVSVSETSKKWGLHKYEAVKTITEPEGETEHSVSEVRFTWGKTLPYTDKKVIALIDNQAPRGVVRAEAHEIMPAPPTVDPFGYCIYALKRAFLGQKLVRVTFNIPEDADVYSEGVKVSGVETLEYKLAGDKDSTSLCVENNQAYIDFYQQVGKEVSFEIDADSIRLVDGAGNKSDPGVVSLEADFDIVVFDDCAPNIEYEYDNTVFSENDKQNKILYFDKPLSGRVVIDDYDLGDNEPAATDITKPANSGGVKLTSDSYTKRDHTWRDVRAYDITTSESEQGEFQFKTEMKDKAGHPREAMSDILRVDLADPVIKVQIDGNEAEGSGIVYFDHAVKVDATLTELWPVYVLADKPKTYIHVFGTTDDGYVYDETYSDWGEGDSEGNHTITTGELKDGKYNIEVAALDKVNRTFYSADFVTFVVDTKDPIVTLKFDTYEAKNGKYYNVDRTATITVEDFTFDEKLVDLDLSEKYGTAEKSGWSDGGLNVHIMTIKFTQDGIYSLTVKCKDMLGHDSNVAEEKEFYIDKTAPEITVAYNNNDARNGFYFKESRTAFVKVDDLSFDESLIEAASQSIEGLDSLPSLGGFEGSGKEHTGHMYFEADGMYGYTIKCEDLAGNVYSGYTSDVFVIDTTSPEVKFAGVENFSANNGTVAPSVTYVDKNMDMNATAVTMTGSNNGPVTVGSQVAPAENGFVVSYADFEHVKSMDDLYTLDATVYDLAGNETKEQLVFSVNRFGSVFVLGDAAKVLNEQYYTREPKDVAITEINVDELTYKNVSISRDGDVKELKNGKQYKVTKQGSDTTWKTYTYTISKNNFEKDGIYSVTVYTKDRATNVQDNKSRDAEVNFAVDKTAPSIVAAGLKDGGVYKETSHVVNIDVTDNMGVTSLTVYRNGEVVDTYDAEALETGDVKSLTLEESENRQTVSIVAEDVAGNVETVVYNNILVSTKEEKVETVETNNNESGTDIGEVQGAVRSPVNVTIFIVLALGIVAAGTGAGYAVYRKKENGSEK